MTCLHLVTIVSVRPDSWKYFCSAFKSYHRKPIYRDFFTPASTIDKLIEMRLTTMADAFRTQLDDPKFKEVPFEDLLGMLVDIEYSN